MSLFRALHEYLSVKTKDYVDVKIEKNRFKLMTTLEKEADHRLRHGVIDHSERSEILLRGTIWEVCVGGLYSSTYRYGPTMEQAVSKLYGFEDFRFDENLFDKIEKLYIGKIVHGIGSDQSQNPNVWNKPKDLLAYLRKEHCWLIWLSNEFNDRQQNSGSRSLRLDDGFDYVIPHHFEQ